MPDLSIVFGFINKSDAENGRALHRIPFLMIITQSEWEEGNLKNGSILQPLTVYACFMGKWNTEMMSESKIEPYSCIVVRRPKNFLQVYLCEKKIEGLLAL